MVGPVSGDCARFGTRGHHSSKPLIRRPGEHIEPHSSGRSLNHLEEPEGPSTYVVTRRRKQVGKFLCRLDRRPTTGIYYEFRVVLGVSRD